MSVKAGSLWIQVWAKSLKEACEKALDGAGNHLFPTGWEIYDTSDLPVDGDIGISTEGPEHPEAISYRVEVFRYDYGHEAHYVVTNAQEDEAENKKAALVKKIKSVDEYFLDDIVLDVYTSMASNLNNEGVESQLDFLLRNGCTVDGLLGMLEG